jgi:DNA-binding NtrC family response regulator
MLSVFRVLTEVAGHDVPVLLRGESGTGKSVVARALHQTSSRSAHAFVTVDCSALASSLRPSFRADLATEADRAGEHDFHALVAAAAGGTILLQEIAALPARLQAETRRRRRQSGALRNAHPAYASPRRA